MIRVVIGSVFQALSKVWKVATGGWGRPLRSQSPIKQSFPLSPPFGQKGPFGSSYFRFKKGDKRPLTDLEKRAFVNHVVDAGAGARIPLIGEPLIEFANSREFIVMVETEKWRRENEQRHGWGV
jgi:hypothetical protein